MVADAKELKKLRERGLNLKRMRESSGLTVSECSQNLGVPKSDLQSIESGNFFAFGRQSEVMASTMDRYARMLCRDSETSGAVSIKNKSPQEDFIPEFLRARA